MLCFQTLPFIKNYESLLQPNNIIWKMETENNFYIKVKIAELVIS